MRCSDESDNSTESESDSDSDSTPIKRPKVKVKKYKCLPKDWTNRNDKYKVWCTQVQEESLTEDLISCDVTKKRYQERSVENYNFTLGYAHKNREHHNNNSSDDEKDIERRLSNKRTSSDRYNIKLRLGKRKSPTRKSPTDFDSQKGSVRIIPDLSTTVESMDADVATDITTKLCEKKDLLISTSFLFIPFYIYRVTVHFE